MRQLFKLQFIRFGLLRILSFFIGIGLMNLFHNLFALDDKVSYLITLVVLLLISYFISARWVFQKNMTKKSFLQYILYVGSISLLSVPFFNFLDNYFQLNYLVSSALSLGAVFLLKFFLIKKNIFNSGETNSL